MPVDTGNTAFLMTDYYACTPHARHEWRIGEGADGCHLSLLKSHVARLRQALGRFAKHHDPFLQGKMGFQDLQCNL